MHHHIYLHTILSLALAPSLFPQVHSLPTPSFFYPPNPAKHQQQIFTSLHLSIPSIPSRPSALLNNNNLHTNSNNIAKTHDRESENGNDGAQGRGTITMYSTDLGLRIPMKFSFIPSSSSALLPSDSSIASESPQPQKPLLQHQNVELTQLSDLTAYLLLTHPSGISFTPAVPQSGGDATKEEIVTSHVLTDSKASVRIAVSLSPRIEQQHNNKNTNENENTLKAITNNEIKEAQKDVQEDEGEARDNFIENDTWRLIIGLMHATVLALRKELMSRGERRGFESVGLVGECEGVMFDGRWHFAGT